MDSAQTLLREVVVEPVATCDEGRYRELLDGYHALKSLPKIGQTIWYVAHWRGEWVALMSMSAAAMKCAPRDDWIGWDFRTQYGRLNLVANNSRFLILPNFDVPNLGSRLLGLLSQRIMADWHRRFGHPVWPREAFVDPQRFHGTIYRPGNWLLLGQTQGYRRTRGGYSRTPSSPKWVFVYPLILDCRARLTGTADSLPLSGARKIVLNAEQMRSLPDFFKDIPDPRTRAGRRHPLPAVLPGPRCAA